MKTTGALDEITLKVTESAASTFTQETVSIVDNIVHGNAIVITEVIFLPNEPADVAPVGAGTELISSQLARKSQTAIINLDDDDLIALGELNTYGDGTDTLFVERTNSHWKWPYEIDSKGNIQGGLAYPYKYLYHAIQSSNVGSTGVGYTQIRYFPVKLTDDELSEITQEHIIND